ncbi:hypothetical protein [Alkalimarinus coralli]|uniref:hypothetical protein n=1 Tax=Alkalimarinus coralli TaxID=2935863 RepID=UPI00202B48EC|nr:hypothetical protein [Alkalimarinus coralli]
MISFLIYVLEFVLICLLGYLGFKVITLFNNSLPVQADRVAASNPSRADIFKDSTDTASHYSRAESITSSQIFAGIQLLEIKRKGINPHSPGQDWIDNGISYYLLGAVSAITEHFDCDGNDKDDVMKYLLTKNLKYTNEQAERHISNLYQVNDETIERNAFYAGIDAAKTWLSKKFIPDEHSLFSNLNTLGFVA